ncbi:MAG: DUF2520 domain-containing protein [Burkholderiales bacterium]|nr:DUF2520 domain-containing protein [Burkholderiales bacterium]
MVASPRIGFVGAGRVARALAQGFARHGEHVVAVASRSALSAERVAREVPGCAAMAAQDAVDACDVVFVTVPDGAIAGTAAGLRWSPGKAAVHTSGATEITALDGAARQGAAIGGLHPMQNFADPAVALAGLPGCAAAIEAEGELLATLDRLACSLGMKPIRLPPGARALYHCSGSFAAPFIGVLLHEAVKLWARFGVSADEALPLLVALARGTLDSVAKDGTVQSFAGPISRGDTGTIARHLAALAKLPPETLALYRALAARAIPIAEAKGSLSAEAAATLHALIGDG